MTADDYKLAEWVLTGQAQSEGLMDSEKIRWQLYRDDSGVWKSEVNESPENFKKARSILLISPKIIRPRSIYSAAA